MRVRALLVTAALLGAGLASGVTSAAHAAGTYTVTKTFVEVPAAPGSTEKIKLWTSIYQPVGADAANPVPVVLHTHGWGGRHDKGLELQSAQMLAGEGYAVVGWDSRGFGNSEGWVELNSPDFEVRDAQRMLDYAATLPFVLKDAAGDPRAGMVGGSYGGGIQLLTAAFDRRLDAIVPLITWNDLPRSLAPDGVVKLGWVSLLFGAGVVSGLVGDTPPDPARSHLPDYTVDPILIDFFASGLATGTLSAQAYDALKYRSPASYMGRIRTPTLLIQGIGDTLFPWREAVDNFLGLRANGTPVKLIGTQWGHSEPAAPGELTFTGGADDVIGSSTLNWFDRYLRQSGAGTGPSIQVRADWLPTNPADGFAPFLEMDSPVRPDRAFALDAGGALTTTNPAPSSARVAQLALAPTSYTEFSGFSGAGAPGDQPAQDLPGTFVAFDTPALTGPLDVAGIGRVSFPISSTATDTVVYLKLMDVAPDGTSTLVRRTVAPARLQTNPAGLTSQVNMDLVGAFHRWDTGHKLRLVVATGDLAFLNTRQPGVYTISTGGITGASLRLPVLS